MRVAYLTDVEGRFEKLERFSRLTPGVELDGDRLRLGPDTYFVFGGDAVDRGPAANRIMALLLEAKERYGERVVLLSGNRDLNKLRLRRELGGHDPHGAPPEVLADRVTHLDFILRRTMGAPEAYAHRAAETGTEGEALVEGWLADLAPDGLHSRYLAACQLAFRTEDTLFVHGGVTRDSLFAVPGRRHTLDSVDGWIAALNAFHREGIEGYREGAVRGGIPAEQGLVDYQAPLPGTRANPHSVVYGRMADVHNDPRLPSQDVVDALRHAGLRRLVVGHTPTGDLPSVLRHDGFTLVLADNAYSRLEAGPGVWLDEDVHVRGRVQLDDGTELDVATDGEPEIGLATEDGFLVKGLAPGAYVGFRSVRERVTEQQLRPRTGLRAPGSL